MNRTFAEKVREARSELGLSQGKLAELCGVSTRTILCYEKGTMPPRRGTLLRLAKALKVSVKFLTDETCENPLADIERDGYIAEARKKFGDRGAKELSELLADNIAMLSGGDVSQEEKDKFFEAVMTAYVTCKEKAKVKYGRKYTEERPYFGADNSEE